MIRGNGRVSPVLVGLLASAIMIGLLVLAFGNINPFYHPALVKAEVTSGDTLAPGADVEVAGVKVGTVQSIDKGNPGGLVSMAVDGRLVKLYRDASANVRPHGVFGPKFIELAPGTASAGDMPDGATIGIERTKVAVDFDQVLNELNPDTRTSLKTFFYEFGTGQENRGQDIGVVIDSLKVVTDQLPLPLNTIDKRATELGNFMENSATVNETLAASPLDQVIHDNADVLAKFDARRASLNGVIDHGNNVLADLDQVLAGNNVANLRGTLTRLPGLIDNLDQWNNLMGLGINDLAPVVVPQHGQADGDIGLAIRRTKDAFAECDVSAQPNYDTIHATVITVTPCTGPDGRPYVDPATGHIAHHHVKVLLGLHTTGSKDEESGVLCGPDTSDQAKHTAYNCLVTGQSSVPSAAAAPPGPIGAGATPVSAAVITPSAIEVLTMADSLNLVDLLGAD
ncbi:MAG: MlaD family protein [Candidatus Dormibacteria bacterium]